MNQSYAADVLMEPMTWIVDNFTHVLGPVSTTTFFFPFKPSCEISSYSLLL